jgi:hypothetical protein
MHSHLDVLRRVGQVLLIYCGLHLFAVVGDVLSQQPHSFAVDALTGVLGLLLVRGSLGAARFTAFVHALTLACAAGAIVALLVVVTLHLGPRVTMPHDCVHEWLLLVWGAGWWMADLGLSLWVVLTLRDPAVEAALSRSRRGSTVTSLRWGAGVGFALAALVVPAAICLQRAQAGVEPLAFAAVEQRLGPGWHMELLSFEKRPKRWLAHVRAQRGDEVRQLDVGDPAPGLAE